MGCQCPTPSVSLRPTLPWPKENICPMVQCRLTETRVCPEQCSSDQHSSMTNYNSHTFWEHFFKHGFVPTSRSWWLWAGGEEMQEKGWGLRCWQPSDAADNARWGKGSIVLSCWQQNKQQVKLEQGKYSYTKRKKPVTDSKCDWATGPSDRGSTDCRPTPSQRDSIVIAGGSMEPSHCSLPFGPGRLAIPGLPCYKPGCSAAPSHPRRAQRAGAQCLKNFTPFFKVIAKNQEKALACFWCSFEWNWYFGGMAICKELTPR